MQSDSDGRSRRGFRLRRLGLLVAAPWLWVSLVIAAAGCGSDSDSAGGGDQIVLRGPTHLGASELITEADRICVTSRRRYAAVESAPVTTAAEAERQATALAEVAGSSFEALGALKPPPSLEGDYRDYVAARGRMRDYLVDARNLAAGGSLAGFEQAKARIDAEQPDRYEIARRVGFAECSPRR